MKNIKRFIDNSVYYATTVLVYCVLPVIYLLNWWSVKVDGVEPKSGQQSYDHIQRDGDTYYRKAGLRYRFTPWTKVTKKFFVFNHDVNSLYPTQIWNPS